MIPAQFEYVRANNVAHAIELMHQHGENARLLAGGHSLIPAMKLRLAQPKLLVDIGNLRELQYIRQEGSKIAVGALSTHYQIETSDLLAAKAPALVQAAAVVADAQVRNRGTIGGVIAHADPQADYTAVLLALDAEVIVAGRQGIRTIRMESLFTGPFTTCLQSGDILTAVRIPAVAERSASVYRKFVRRHSDYGTTGVAASISLGRDGICTSARVGITCVALVPYRARLTEAELVGKRLTPELIAAAADKATAGQVINEDAYTPADYREHLCKVETRRAITDALLRLE